MPVALSKDTIAVVKATVPVLKDHGLAVTERLYHHLFKNPDIKALFNASHHGAGGTQPTALAQAVLAYARNIDNLGALTGAVERIAQKHVGLNILPEHYPVVEEALLNALRDVLGDAATPQILDAWQEAYRFLADILMNRESQIYSGLREAEGGWNGWRDFRIARVVEESAVVRSFYLEPVDGGAVIRHKPGQYLTFWLEIPGGPPLKRNYSISCAPNGRFYRITVKKEPLLPGASFDSVSTWLHENTRVGQVLKVAPPAGDFFLDEGDQRPVMLVSGGVGLTPMVSMLETLVEGGSDRPAWYIHGALNGRVHAMGDHVRQLAAKAANVNVEVFYAEPQPGDDAHDRSGLITAEWLHGIAPDNAVYYVCGPKAFLRDIAGGLLERGVHEERVRFEFFGPTEDLLAS